MWANFAWHRHHGTFQAELAHDVLHKFAAHVSFQTAIADAMAFEASHH